MRKIRTYDGEDLEGVLSLIRANTPAFFDPSEEEEFKEYLETEREDYFVIVDQGKIIACGGINYFPDDNIARIAWDMIHPDHHCEGLGSKLVKYRLDHIARNASVSKVLVRTSQLVFRFYEKMGFELKEVVKDHWAIGYDMYVMEQDVER